MSYVAIITQVSTLSQPIESRTSWRPYRWSPTPPAFASDVATRRSPIWSSRKANGDLLVGLMAKVHLVNVHPSDQCASIHPSTVDQWVEGHWSSLKVPVIFQFRAPEMDPWHRQTDAGSCTLSLAGVRPLWAAAGGASRSSSRPRAKWAASATRLVTHWGCITSTPAGTAISTSPSIGRTSSKVDRQRESGGGGVALLYWFFFLEKSFWFEGKEKNFKVKDSIGSITLNLPYDVGSIMHYGE